MYVVLSICYYYKITMQCQDSSLPMNSGEPGESWVVTNPGLRSHAQ